MNIEDRKRRQWNEKEIRRNGSSNSQIPAWFFIAASVICLAGTSMGVYIGIQASNDTTEAVAAKGKTHFFIDGYQFTFLPGDHSKIQGRHGFVYPDERSHIYIQANLSEARTKVVCQHEMMHAMGIGREHHDFIYNNHNIVRSEVCNKLMEKLQDLNWF